MCHWPTKCEHMEGSTDISFQTQFLQFVWISSNKIHSKINVFPHLSSENCEINSLNLTHQGLSNNTKNTPKFQCSFQFLFYLIFIEKIVLIINSFHTIAQNSLKSSPCTPTHQELFENTTSMTWSIRWFGGWQCDTIKQGLCRNVALPFTLKKYLKAKEELWKFKYFTMQKHDLQKNPLKETKILQDTITL